MLWASAYAGLPVTGLVTDVTANATTSKISIARVNSGTPEWLYTNHLGSPIKGANSAGTVTWSEQYDSYGETRLNPGQQADEIGFTGHIEE